MGSPVPSTPKVSIHIQKGDGCQQVCQTVTRKDGNSFFVVCLFLRFYFNPISPFHFLPPHLHIYSALDLLQIHSLFSHKLPLRAYMYLYIHTHSQYTLLSLYNVACMYKQGLWFSTRQPTGVLFPGEGTSPLPVFLWVFVFTATVSM